MEWIDEVWPDETRAGEVWPGRGWHDGAVTDWRRNEPHGLGVHRHGGRGWH
jgi:hypothetical protein